MKKQTHLHLGWPKGEKRKFSAGFYFWVDYSIKWTMETGQKNKHHKTFWSGALLI